MAGGIDLASGFTGCTGAVHAGAGERLSTQYTAHCGSRAGVAMKQQMKFYTEIAVHTLALALAFLWANSSKAGAESKAMVDVRFDAPYRQIDSSMGDEWAPTWGRDDV